MANILEFPRLQDTIQDFKQADLRSREEWVKHASTAILTVNDTTTIAEIVARGPAEFVFWALQKMQQDFEYEDYIAIFNNLRDHLRGVGTFRAL